MGYSIVEIEEAFKKGLGDDLILGLDTLKGKTPSEWLQYASDKAHEYFGPSISKKKSGYSQSPNGVVCLGYTNKNGFPHRDEMKLLAGLLNPERGKTWAKLRAAAIGIS